MSSTRPIPPKELAGYIHTELQQSQNWHGSEWREAIKRALDYFLLRQKGDEIDGRSKIQSGDVADMIDHIQAELQPMYSDENLIQLEPTNEQDEEAARIESEALNWYFFQRSRGFDAMDEAVQDGLLSRNGYLKIWHEQSYGLPYEETLEGTQIQVDAGLMQLGQSAQVRILDEAIIQTQQVSTIEGTDTDGVTPIIVDVETAPEIMSVRVQVTPIRNEVKIESPAPEDIYISKDAVGASIQQPRFVAQRRRMARQDVKALGFDQVMVDRMPSMSAYDSDVRTARKSDFNTYARYAAHQSGQLVDLYEVYYRVDADADGIPELHKIFYSSNQEILQWADSGELCDELVRVRPFASGSPMRVAHRHQGRSISDKLFEVEDAKRALIRQMLDNLYLGNDVGLVLGPTVEMEDIEDTDIGACVRAQNPGDVQPIPYTNTAGQSLQGLQYMDLQRRERAGTSLDFSTENVPVNQAAHSTERIMSAMEKLLAMYARNFARTLIRDAFVLLHQQLRLLPDKLQFRSRAGWKETEPRYWMEREFMSVTLGMSEGERLRKIGALRELIAVQREDAASTASATLVSTDEMYEARVDLARAAGIQDASQYFVDPRSPEGIRAQQKATQATQEQQQAAQEQQQALIMAQMQVAEMQEETKRQRAQLETLEAQRDRVADMLTKAEELAAKYAEMELKYGVDVPERGVEDGEVVAFNPAIS